MTGSGQMPTSDSMSPYGGVLQGMQDPKLVEKVVVDMFKPPRHMGAEARGYVMPGGQWTYPGMPGIGNLNIPASEGGTPIDARLAMPPAAVHADPQQGSQGSNAHSGSAGQMHQSPSYPNMACIDFTGSESPSLYGSYMGHGQNLAAHSPEQALGAQLAQAEEQFLGSDVVTSHNVSEAELAARFQQTQMAEAPSDVGEYMQSLVGGVVRDSVHCSAPKMIGHMTSSLPYFLRPLSKLATTLNQNTVKTETAKTVTFLERESLAMVHRVLYGRDDKFYKQYVQDPGTILGLFTSGGTLANVSALWIARNAALPPQPAEGDRPEFLGVEKEGMPKALAHYGYTDAVVLGSKLLHYSLAKAGDVLGVGVNGLKSVPYDDMYRVHLDQMERQIEQCRRDKVLVIALVGIAGATETGSIDNLEGIANLSEKYNLHFHVDAAWGGPCIFSTQHREKLAGIERAHSVTLDGHKQLYMPMGCGLCVLREPDMVHVVRKCANYIIRKESYDLGKFTLEGSRPANALYLHANLNILGRKGYGALVDKSVNLTQYMADRVRQMGNWEMVAEPQLNILLYRHVPEKLYDESIKRPLTAEENKEVDQMNIWLQTSQKTAGRTFVSRTTVYCPRQSCNVVALRVVIANPLTQKMHIDAVLKDQEDILARKARGDSPEEGPAAPARQPASPVYSTPAYAMTPPPGKPVVHWPSVWAAFPADAKAKFGSYEEFRKSVQPQGPVPAGQPPGTLPRTMSCESVDT